MKTEYSYNPTTVYIDPNAIDMEEYGAPMSEENPMKVVVKEIGKTPEGLGALDGWMHVNPTSLQIDIESVAWQLNNDDARPNMEKVTVDMLKKGEPWKPSEMVDARG